MTSNIIAGKDLSDLVRQTVDSDSSDAEYDPELISGYFYTLRVGKKAYLARTPAGQEQAIEIKFTKPLRLQGDREVVLRSLESFKKIPDDIYGELSLNPELAKMGVVLIAPSKFYPGVIGFPHFIISNLTYSNVVLNLGDKLVDVQFFRLKEKITEISSPFWSFGRPNLPVLTKPEKMVDSFPAVEASVNLLRQEHDELKRVVTEISSYGYYKPHGTPPDSTYTKDPIVNLKSNPLFSQNSSRPTKVVSGTTTTIDTVPALTLSKNVLVEVIPSNFLTKNCIQLLTKAIPSGYNGNITLQLYNYGLEDLNIPDDEILAFAKLTQMGLIAFSEGEEVLRDNQDLPDSKGVHYSTAEVRKMLGGFEDKLKDYDAKINADRRIIDLFFMAAIAGIIAGVFITLITSLTRTENTIQGIVNPKNIAIFLGVTILVSLAVMEFWKLRSKKEHNDQPNENSH
ncbi:MAG: hypothetical protein WD751_07610 [Anaerolineales bacterium]